GAVSRAATQSVTDYCFRARRNVLPAAFTPKLLRTGLTKLAEISSACIGITGSNVRALFVFRRVGGADRP
ncbi:MAG: hypothetical protein FWD12_14090, partial [Alphaproteobacteria bacterium]|nr:hypothetical protein [Alphaproteobacteria bacterium]